MKRTRVYEKLAGVAGSQGTNVESTMGVLICNNVTADRRNWSNENKFPLAAHRRGAAPGGADAARNPLLSDMAAAGRSCFGVWILGVSLEVSRVMGAHMWALTH